MSYCESSKGHPWHQPHHDHVHGFPVTSDQVLFERLVMEINQPGLSWLTILQKQDAFKEVFLNYDLTKIAAFNDSDIDRLLSNSQIVRNRKKIEAVIYNAGKLLDFGTFKDWLDNYHPLPLNDWIKLFRQTSKFTGPSVTHEFLMSVGYLPGAHQTNCPIYERITELRPPCIRI